MHPEGHWSKCNYNQKQRWIYIKGCRGKCSGRKIILGRKFF